MKRIQPSLRISSAALACGVALASLSACSWLVLETANEHAPEGSSSQTSGGEDGTGGSGSVTPSPSCETASDCNTTPTLCIDVDCVDAQCVITEKSEPEPAHELDPAPECKKWICDDGQPKLIDDDAVLQDDGNPCTEKSCNNGARKNTELGTQCQLSGKPDLHGACDGKGSCIWLCENDNKDILEVHQESDVDCGGHDGGCARCGEGKTCDSSEDCLPLLECNDKRCVSAAMPVPVTP